MNVKDKTHNEVISEIDEPKTKTSSKDPKIEAKRMEETTKRTMNKQEHERDLIKFKTGRNIMFCCLISIALFYISEIILSINGVEIEPQIKMTLIQPVTYILTTTLGFMFAEYNNKSKNFKID